MGLSDKQRRRRRAALTAVAKPTKAEQGRLLVQAAAKAEAAKSKDVQELSELKRFEVETGGSGGEEKGNASVFGQTVQARLPPCAPTGNKWPHTTSTGPTVTGASGAKKG